mgnify:CR=1 FL=1
MNRSLPFLEFIVRCVIGVLFIASAVPKLRQPYLFLADVYAYELLSPSVAKFSAVVIPVLELTIGALLLAGVLLPGALIASAVVSIVFFVAQVAALARGLRIDCGCFGASGAADPIGFATISRVVLFCLASIACLMVLRRSTVEDVPEVSGRFGRALS